jgi:hypothetical protein
MSSPSKRVRAKSAAQVAVVLTVDLSGVARAFHTLVQHSTNSSSTLRAERQIEDFQGLPVLHRFFQREVDADTVEVRQTRHGLFSTDRMHDGFEKRTLINAETGLLRHVQVVECITRNREAPAGGSTLHMLHRANRASLTQSNATPARHDEGDNSDASVTADGYTELTLVFHRPMPAQAIKRHQRRATAATRIVADQLSLPNNRFQAPRDCHRAL